MVMPPGGVTTANNIMERDNDLEKMGAGTIGQTAFGSNVELPKDGDKDKPRALSSITQLTVGKQNITAGIGKEVTKDT